MLGDKGLGLSTLPTPEPRYVTFSKDLIHQDDSLQPFMGWCAKSYVPWIYHAGNFSWVRAIHAGQSEKIVFLELTRELSTAGNLATFLTMGNCCQSWVKVATLLIPRYQQCFNVWRNDRLHPLDRYGNIELYSRFRLHRIDIMALVNKVSDELQLPIELEFCNPFFKFYWRCVSKRVGAFRLHVENSFT